MHVYYKFGLLLIFILSVSTCCTRAAPATNQSSSFDNYPDDYDDDYYDDLESDTNVTTSTSNRLMPFDTSTTTTTTTTTTISPLFKLDIPKRSNHVLEPNCPKACLCLEDYKFIQCSKARLTHVPDDMPSTALMIDLSENHISELRADDFVNCSKVREINLNGNQLSDVQKEVFEGLRRLQRLRLADNRLTHIDPDTFAAASDLSQLDLSNNSIALPRTGSFLNQPELTELACRNCSWSELYDDTFANLSGLTSLKLDKNEFNKKINTRAFTPLRNLIKLKLPALDQTSIQELCNLLKSIDNISFKHFDISCFELVLGASFNESLILATDPPYKPPSAGGLEAEAEAASTPAATTATKVVNVQQQSQSSANNGATASTNMTAAGSVTAFSNLTLPLESSNSSATAHDETVLSAGVIGAGVTTERVTAGGNDKDKVYQVPISQEAINIMLICIMIIAIIGIIIGIICRKDIGGIKTKCCRTRKPEPKDQVHPAEEIPLNKLA